MKKEAFVQVLVLDKVFYVIALLNLPKVWMTGTFLMAVKHASETLVATRRFFHFLEEVEPQIPSSNAGKGVHMYSLNTAMLCKPLSLYFILSKIGVVQSTQS